MELIERYVMEVGRHLPRRLRKDVTRELRSTLEDSLEGRAAASDDEAATVAMLREFGKPEDIAASYRTGPRYLIGPDLYPSFINTVKIAALVIVGLLALGSVFSTFDGPWSWSRVGHIWLELFSDVQSTLFSLLGLIVLIFAVVERFRSADATGDAEETEWDPSTLPPLQDPDRIDRTGIIAWLAIATALLVLLNFLPDKFQIVATINGKGVHIPLLGPTFAQVLPALNFCLLASLVMDALVLWAGRWRPWLRLGDLIVTVLWAALLYRMVFGDPLLEQEVRWLVDHGMAQANAQRYTDNVAPIMHFGVRLGLAIGLASTVISALKKTYKLVRR